MKPAKAKQEYRNGVFRPAIAMATVLSALALFQALPLLGSQLDPPRQYYYQPDNQIYLNLLDEQERDITEIIRQRMQKVWGADASPYLSALTSKPYEGYYQSDSVLSQRRSIRRSSLFASDLDFIEVAISTFDGKFSLRETYAINRNDKRWVVIDSAGFPLFERIIEISDDQLDSDQKQRDFLLTLLSYAGYGSFDILSAPDSIYHGIDLGEKLGEDYYPFESVNKGDTIETSFTCCLRDGVEVSRWRIKYFVDGLLIDESEQLVTYEDLPQPEIAVGRNMRDTGALASLLRDIPGDSLANDSLSDSSRATATPRPQAPGGDIRLADLLSGKLNTPLATGHVSYEIISAKLLIPTDSTTVDRVPEFAQFVEPVYPPEALAERAEGEVEIMIRVDSSGRARQAMIRKRAERKLGFEISAKRAGELSKFRPGIAGGQPADMWLTYIVRYRLSGTSYKDNDTTQADSAQSNSSQSDTTISDSATSDSAASDSATSDSIIGDSTSTDSAATDSSRNDSVVGDTTKATIAPDLTNQVQAILDSLNSGSTLLDSTSADSLISDTNITDSSKTDTTPTDKAISDSTKANSAKSDTSKAKSDTSKVENDTSAKAAPADTTIDNATDSASDSLKTPKEDSSKTSDTTKAD